jgi:hypothetical protein
MYNITISISQLGFCPESEKCVTLLNPSHEIVLPDKIPFFIQRSGDRLKRDKNIPCGWQGKYFRWPFDLGKGNIDENEINEKSHEPKPLYKGFLIRKSSRWGDVWQSAFSDFTASGVFQIETQYQMSPPFQIQSNIYERPIWSYLNFIHAQRSGFNNPGIRPATHLDDGVTDSDGRQVDVSGGWYDAGDYRKWMGLTLGNLEALFKIANCGILEFERKASEEIKWGNKYFHAMVNDEGHVYEDVGGGDFRGTDYRTEWWYENHPGCNCDNAGNVLTDNVSGSGDERLIRTAYNPLVQYQFIMYQAMVAKVFDDEYGEKCLQLAKKVWDYAQSRPQDDRTLFLSGRILAALELNSIIPAYIKNDEIIKWIKQLLIRQNKDKEGISGFFTEKDHSDGFRSIIYSCFPIDAIVAAFKYFDQHHIGIVLKDSINLYVENYVLKDAQSNPFHVNPYGVFLKTPFKEYQTYRPAGKNKFIRTFMHPISEEEVIHGTNSVVTHHAGLLIELSLLMQKPEWRIAGERLIQWAMGHNTAGVSLFSGIGYRIPVAFSAVHPQIPHAPYAGFIGTPEDCPYQETSNWVEWSTQEVWDVPFYGIIRAAVPLIKHSINNKNAAH